MRLKLETVSAIALAAAVGTLAMPATAQDSVSSTAQADAQENRGIEDIVVTARKREESLQSVPIAVTALTSETLQNQTVQSVKDIQYQTPSLVISPTNADRNSLAVTIRGQSVSDTLLTVDPAIGIYIDGVNFAKTVGTELSTLTDVERVEVLKGPQGTLFGRNTTGGALTITSKLPTGEFEGEATIRTDEYSRIGGSLVLNLPIAGDTLALRLVGSYDKRDAFGNNYASVGLTPIGGDLDGGSIRGTLLWRPADTVQIVLRGDYNRSATSAQAWKPRYLFTGAPGVVNGAIAVGAAVLGTPFLIAVGTAGSATCVATPAAAACAAARATLGAGLVVGRDAYLADANTPTFYDVYHNVNPSHSRVESYGGSGTIDIDLSDTIQFKSITSYRELTRNTLFDMDGSRFAILAVNGITSQKIVSEEAQFTGTLADDRLNWIAGGFYSRETGNDGTRTRALNALNPNLNVIDGDVDNRSIAGFAQVTYRLTDKFSVTGGLRYTKDTKELESRNVARNAAGVVVQCNVPSPVSATNCSQSFKNSWDAFSYTGVVDFKPVDGILLYAKTSRGFRSGGFNLRGSADPLTFQPFDPEFVTDYEAGFKGDLFDRRVRLNVAGYRSGYNNIQRSIIVPSGNGSSISTVVRNAARARIIGLEGELTVQPTDGLTFRATGALVDAKYTNYRNGAGVDLSSQKFPYTPKWTYSLSGAYEFPIDNGPLRIQADWVWQDDIYFFPDSPLNGTNGLPDLRGQNAYGLLNGRISKSFDREGVDVAFFIRNALSKKYFAVGLDTSASLGFNSGVVGDPRVIGAEARIKF